MSIKKKGLEKQPNHFFRNNKESPFCKIKIAQITAGFRSDNKSLLAILVCCDKACDKLAYICAEESCKCYKEHYACPHVSIKSIINKIQSKIIPFEHFHKSISEKIDQTIDQLSGLKEKIQNQIKHDFTHYGLTNKDKLLFNALHQQKITGKQFFKSYNEAINLVNEFVEKQPLDKKFSQLWKSIDSLIKNKSNEFFKFLGSIKNFDSQFIDIKKLKDYSKISMAEQSPRNLLQMFGDKMPQSAKLLYRASENNYQTNKFHEMCDNIPHTLTVCETTHGKVIGGYTPLPWDKTKSGQIKDESGTSFIFSLTNNHKFTLDKSKTAISQYANHGPIFGNSNPDLGINGSSNSNISNSWAYTNRCYSNSNYTAYNGDSNMKFTGNPDKSDDFKTKEWQVWQLKFQ